MKVKDLLEAIEDSKNCYSDFLEWDVYTEQISETDKVFKTGKGVDGFQKDWGHLTDSEGWLYVHCAGFNTLFEKEKVFTINVNY